MTLQELSQTLPNGSHDAEVAHIELDYPRREARGDLKLWVGALN